MSDEQLFDEVDAGDTIWRFERSFMTSNWTCIWGRGCLGIGDTRDSVTGHGCCSLGAELDGVDEAMNLAAMAATLTPEIFQFHDKAQTGGIFRDEQNNATRVVDGAQLGKPWIDIGRNLRLRGAGGFRVVSEGEVIDLRAPVDDWLYRRIPVADRQNGVRCHATGIIADGGTGGNRGNAGSVAGLVRIVIGQVAKGHADAVLEGGIVDVESVVVDHQLHAGSGESCSMCFGYAGFITEVSAVIDRCTQIADFGPLEQWTSGNDGHHRIGRAVGIGAAVGGGGCDIRKSALYRILSGRARAVRQCIGDGAIDEAALAVLLGTGQHRCADLGLGYNRVRSAGGSNRIGVAVRVRTGISRGGGGIGNSGRGQRRIGRAGGIGDRRIVDRRGDKITGADSLRAGGAWLRIGFCGTTAAAAARAQQQCRAGNKKQTITVHEDT